MGSYSMKYKFNGNITIYVYVWDICLNANSINILYHKRSQMADIKGVWRGGFMGILLIWGNNIYITGKIVWFEKLTDNLSRPYPSWDRLSTNMCWISRRKWMDEWFEEFKIVLKGAERHLWKRNATNRQSSCLLDEDLLVLMWFWFMYHGIFINMCLIHTHTHGRAHAHTCK